jgi:signal transduction histidine kinase
LKNGGLGLGLSITKSIVESMNGCIDFHPLLERGTVFNITLPLNTERKTGA